jgi:hypothetical protein
MVAAPVLSCRTVGNLTSLKDSLAVIAPDVELAARVSRFPGVL